MEEARGGYWGPDDHRRDRRHAGQRAERGQCRARTAPSGPSPSRHGRRAALDPIGPSLRVLERRSETIAAERQIGAEVRLDRRVGPRPSSRPAYATRSFESATREGVDYLGDAERGGPRRSGDRQDLGCRHALRALDRRPQSLPGGGHPVREHSAGGRRSWLGAVQKVGGRMRLTPRRATGRTLSVRLGRRLPAAAKPGYVGIEAPGADQDRATPAGTAT